MWPFFNPTIKVVTFRLRGWCVPGGCVFVAGIHQSRTWTSGSFESARWKCMCAQTRPRFILSSERVFWGNGVWSHVNSKGKIPSTGKCPQRRIEPATLWTASPSTTNWAILAPNVILNLQSRCTAFWDRYQRKTVFVVDVFANWVTNRKWQTTLLDTWKVPQLNLPRQESVK